MKPMADAPRNETWVLLLWEVDGEPKAAAGFWSNTGEDGRGDWYDSEAASHALTDFWGEPMGWLPLPVIQGDDGKWRAPS